jgi:hypothetical protein
MDPRQFTRSFQAQAATVLAVPPLADNYVLAPGYTTDGYTIGVPDLLDMSPQGQLRDAVLGFRPISGLNVTRRVRLAFQYPF